jgi:mannose-6-phosphate isomerase-like protein (cupin superfamily)
VLTAEGEWVKLTRIYTGEDNRSHFEDLELPMTPDRRATSPWLDGAYVAFGESPALEPQDWHHAPRRQLVAVLSGALEIEVGDGTKWRFNTGDCFLADDLSGQGHRTEDVGGPVRLLYAELPPELDPTQWR